MLKNKIKAPETIPGLLFETSLPVLNSDNLKADIQEKEFFIIGSVTNQFGTHGTHSIHELDDIYKNSSKTLLTIPTTYIPQNIIIKENGFKIELPSELKNIADEIEYSKYILTLQEDYDDNGGLPIPQQTWERAITFISKYSQFIYSKLGVVIIAPIIMPATGKDILIMWKGSKFQLLLTIPFNSNSPITYYGDNNKGEDDFKGKLNDKKIQPFFALWIANMSSNEY